MSQHVSFLAGIALLSALFCLGLDMPSHAADAADSRTSYRAYVDGPWGQVHVRVDGSSHAPTVILVHQMIWSSQQFRYAQQELSARGVRSIAVDLPGYGMSDGPPAPPTATEYAEVLLPVMRHFGLKATNLLGVNEGGTIVCAFAAAHPAMVKSLIIEGPVIVDSIGQAKYFSQPHEYQTPRPDGSHLEKLWRHLDSADTKISATLQSPAATKISVGGMQSILMSIFAAGPNGWFAQDAAYRYDLQDLLRRLKMPVMLLTYRGQQFQQAALDLETIRPDFSLQNLDWDGVAASYDAPAEWADAVANYLKSSHYGTAGGRSKTP
ncbi:MAG TPA: alpha/beta hydrolase [Steroidobacteraceae bacterium]|jgi:pimeloyl-ACP methyl ester carboxylesterase